MKITGGTTRSGDISSIFGRIWCWLTGGTWYPGEDSPGGAQGEVSGGGCNYSSIQQNPEGGGDPSGNYELNDDDSFLPVPPSPDFTIPPPEPSTGWVSVYTPPDLAAVSMLMATRCLPMMDHARGNGQLFSYSLQLLIPT